MKEKLIEARNKVAVKYGYPDWNKLALDYARRQRNIPSTIIDSCMVTFAAQQNQSLIEAVSLDKSQRVSTSSLLQQKFLS